MNQALLVSITSSVGPRWNMEKNELVTRNSGQNHWSAGKNLRAMTPTSPGLNMRSAAQHEGPLNWNRVTTAKRE